MRLSRHLYIASFIIGGCGLAFGVGLFSFIGLTLLFAAAAVEAAHE
jgi:hypothetical protein